jgi:hypothetical protein
MNRISRQKLNQLILVAITTLMVLGVLGFTIIRPQFQSLDEIAANTEAAQTKLKQIVGTIKNTATVEAEREETANALNGIEDGEMASGDVYSWTYDTIRRFKQSYRVDIPEISQPSIGNVDLLPGFPYKQLKFTISGTAYYHDLGKFRTKSNSILL